MKKIRNRLLKPNNVYFLSTNDTLDVFLESFLNRIRSCLAMCLIVGPERFSGDGLVRASFSGCFLCLKGFKWELRLLRTCHMWNKIGKGEKLVLIDNESGIKQIGIHTSFHPLKHNQSCSLCFAPLLPAPCSPAPRCVGRMETNCSAKSLLSKMATTGAERKKVVTQRIYSISDDVASKAIASDSQFLTKRHLSAFLR